MTTPSRFAAAAWFMDHAKHRDRVIEMLEADCPLTAEDKAALACGIRRLAHDKLELTKLTRKRTKNDPRKKRSAVPYSFGAAVDEVREVAVAARCTQREAFDLVALRWSWNGQALERHRERIMSRLHIT